jgi:hypothetical protein
MTDVTSQHADDRSIAELVKNLSQQSSELARKEVELAKGRDEPEGPSALASARERLGPRGWSAFLPWALSRRP